MGARPAEVIGGARALLLALLVLVCACASTADAGVPDAGEGCGCSLMANQSGGPVRTVFTTDLPGYDPNASPGLHVGDWVADNSGSGPAPRQVERRSVGGPLVLRDFTAGVTIAPTPAPSFTPGLAGTGSGLIDVALLNRAGVAAANELVDVDVISGGPVTSLGISGGVGVLASTLVVGNSARVRAETDAGGLLRLAFVGTTAVAYRFTIVPVRANSDAAQSDVVAVLSGVLP